MSLNRCPVPPGLTCAECRLGLRDGLSRRTLSGWVHATPCVSPDVLPGRWVTRGGVSVSVYVGAD